MSSLHESIKRAIEGVAQRSESLVGEDEPGFVVFSSSRGRPIASATGGLASLATRSPISLDTMFDTGSVAKVVTGLAVAILEEEGALSPSMRLRDLLPEFPAYGDALRVEHLIHHESGLRSYFSLLYFMAGWHPRFAPSSEEVFDALCHAGSLTSRPGVRYEYCDSNYFLLARIVERVSGEPFGAFAQRCILDPLKMRDSGLTDMAGAATGAEGYERYPLEVGSAYAQRAHDTEPAWHPVQLAYNHVGAEGLRASARDLARLAAHILRPTIVSERTMRDRILHAVRTREDGFGYGYGLNVGTYRGRKYIGHDGQIWGYSASVSVFPDDEIEIVCLTNRADLGAWQLRSGVLDALDGKSPTGSSPSFAAARSRVVGRYLSRATARYLEIAEAPHGQTASIDGSNPVAVAIQEDGSLRGEGLTIAASCDCGAWPSLVVRERGGAADTFELFGAAADCTPLVEYAGAYRCVELDTTFDVAATKVGIRVTNRDARRPSMDLDYEPTIRDFFRSLDPYPGLSQLQFLRDQGEIVAFIYRDPDGDRREDLRFVRIPT